MHVNIEETIKSNLLFMYEIKKKNVLINGNFDFSKKKLNLPGVSRTPDPKITC